MIVVLSVRMVLLPLLPLPLPLDLVLVLVVVLVVLAVLRVLVFGIVAMFDAGAVRVQSWWAWLSVFGSCRICCGKQIVQFSRRNTAKIKISTKQL